MTFVAVHVKAVNAKNILNEFRGIDIYPFLPIKVLRHIASSSSSKSQSRSSISQNLLTLFNEMIFIDSPADFNAVQPGLASSRLVCRLRSQNGRTRFFEGFGRTISNRPSEDSKTKRDDSNCPFKN